MAEPSHQDILHKLKGVNIKDYHKLGLYLNIEDNRLQRIKHENQLNPDQQLSDIIAYWKRNGKDCSWGALATALEKVEGYANLVCTLRGLEASKSDNTPTCTTKNDEPKVTHTTMDNKPKDTPTNNETKDTVSTEEGKVK